MSGQTQLRMPILVDTAVTLDTRALVLPPMTSVLTLVRDLAAAFSVSQLLPVIPRRIPQHRGRHEAATAEAAAGAAVMATAGDGRMAVVPVKPRGSACRMGAGTE
jgi:hypothetical protein